MIKCKIKIKFENETDKNPPSAISIVYFLEARLFTGKLSQRTTIHPGIFGGRGLWVVSRAEKALRIRALVMSLCGRTLSRHVINLNQ